MYVTGETGNSGKIEIAPADASSTSTMPCLGLLESTLSNNAEGFCVQGGLLEGLSTATIDGASANANDTVYVKSGGGLTLTKPTGTGLIQNIAKVARTHASNGSLVVSAILRTNDVPNLPSGKIWVGDGNTTTSTVIHLDETNNRLGINDTTPGVTLDISGTDAIKIPAGTEAERPTGVAGMLRYNSDDAQFEGYTTEWGAIAGSGGGGGGGTELSIEKNVFTATANQTAFTISSAITASSNTQVYIDGVYQAKSNYTTSGSTITFSTGVPAGSEVEVIHFISVLSKVYTDTFTGDGIKVDFTASKDVTDENVTQVYIDGVYQSKNNYTTSGTTITFSTAPPSGSAIEVVHFTPATYSTLNSNQFTGTGSQTDFTLTQEVDEDKSFVFLQGIYQEKSTYSISGTTLTFTTAPQSGYSIEVITVGEVSMLPDTIDIDNFSGTGSQVDFVLTSTPSTENAIDVYINGLYQQKDTFSLSGNTLTFSVAPPNGTTIEVKHQFVASVKGEVVLTAGTGISITENSNNNFTIENTLVDVTVSFNAPTGQSLTYTTPAASSGQAGSIFPTTTFTVTKSGNTLSGTAVITGLPAGITSTQSYNNNSPNNILTITLSGVYPSTNSVGTNLVISNLTVVQDLIVDYLVVAGGGSGGNAGGAYESGGGGAGGLRTSYGSTSGGGGSPEAALSLVVATNYSVTIGSGGNNSNGVNSVFSNITSIGGGKGGTTSNGSNGGSGGGASYNNFGTYQVALGTTGQGFNGGRGEGSDNPTVAPNNGGGGGGAAQVGQDGSGAASTRGYGGSGLAVNIISAINAGNLSVGEVSGSNVYFAGGGAGGSASDGTHQGGIGGGGNAPASANGIAGSPNTGGGGGGCAGSSSANGGQGGSGVVILRYPSTYTLTIGSGLTGSTATDGSDKVTTFTAGTGTISFS